MSCSCRRGSFCLYGPGKLKADGSVIRFPAKVTFSDIRDRNGLCLSCHDDDMKYMSAARDDTAALHPYGL